MSDVIENASSGLLEPRIQTALQANLLALQRKLSGGPNGAIRRVRLMAVMKSSANYNLPAAPEAVAAFLESLEVPPDQYGVVSIDDALAVRRAIPTKPILILYPVEVEFAPLLLAHRIDVAVVSRLWVQKAARTLSRRCLGSRRLGVHIFIDTGHARTGAAPQDAKEIAALLMKHRDLLHVRGIMSHFCCDRRHQGTTIIDFLQKYGLRLRPGLTEGGLQRDASRVHAIQKKRASVIFRNISSHLAYGSPAGHSHRTLSHIATSNAVLNGDTEAFHDMVRVGSALFEGLPSAATTFWSGRALDPALIRRLNWCSAGVHIQAVKLLPARRHSEWCLYYGCLMGPAKQHLPYVVRRPLLVAVISGVCHAYRFPYRGVSIPMEGMANSYIPVLGDQYGSLALLPRSLPLSANLSWWTPVLS